MAANTAPIYVKNNRGAGVTWTNADAAATKKTLLTAGAEGARIHAIAATLDDTTARDVALYLNDGSTDFLVGTATVPLSSGTSGTLAAVNLLSSAVLLPWVASDGSFLLPASWVLKTANVTQVAATKTLTLVVFGGDY